MLVIRGIEVSQSLQYFRADQHLTDPADRGPDNSLTLVANKTAWARVYVENDTTGSLTGVTGTLSVAWGFLNTQSGPALSITPQSPGTATAPFDPDYETTRGSMAQTLNFIVPASRMYGTISITATVKTSDGSQTATKSIVINAGLQQTLKLRGIMIGYNGPNPSNPSTNLTVAAPGLADLQTTAAWALRVMPVQQNGVFQVASTLTRSQALTGTATNGGCTSDWLNLNAAIATAKTADGNHPGFLYYGLIAATFPNTSNNGGCESSGVSSGFNGGQTAMTHEIGHACGRPHAPCGGVGTSADANYPAYEPYDSPSARVASIGEYGLDITNGAIATPETARDYMSYCGPAWISIYGYQKLVNNAALNPEQVGHRRPWWENYVAYDPWWWLHYIPDPPPYWIDPADLVELPVRSTPVISVIGILHANDRVEVLSVTRTSMRSLDIAGTTTGLRAVLQGAKNAELASAPVLALPSRGSCGCGCSDDDDSPRLFQAFIPDVGRGTALSIRDEDLKSVWKRAAPKTQPSVGSVKVSRSKDAVVVSWTSRSKTTDAWVRVSTDEGKTWRAAATSVEGSRSEIDASHLPAGRLLVQVVAHDGFHSVASKPVTFDNAVVPPAPAILHPHKGRRLFAGEALSLWGSVALQDGVSADHFRYAWDLDGKPAGDGLHVMGRVPDAGTHRATFTVRDAKGKVLRSTDVEFTSESGTDRTK
jgi:hypothetical protein